MRPDYVPRRARKIPPVTQGMPYWRIMYVGIVLILGGIAATVWFGNSKTPAKVQKQAPVQAPQTNAEQTGPLEVNSATYEQLRAVPHMTDAMARHLIQLRPFRKWEDLDAVHGIGPKRLEALREHLFIASHSQVPIQEKKPATP
jgi:predicted flap endonuclease-1-like 5' DNA nuclease